MKLISDSWLQPFSAKYYAIEQHVFAFSFIIEGTIEKVLLFIMSLKTIFNQNLAFTEQKLYFGTLQRGSNN
jgi:hypothetical protein